MGVLSSTPFALVTVLRILQRLPPYCFAALVVVLDLNKRAFAMNNTTNPTNPNQSLSFSALASNQAPIHQWSEIVRTHQAIVSALSYDCQFSIMDNDDVWRLLSLVSKGINTLTETLNKLNEDAESAALDCAHECLESVLENSETCVSLLALITFDGHFRILEAEDLAYILDRLESEFKAMYQHLKEMKTAFWEAGQTKSSLSSAKA